MDVQDGCEGRRLVFAPPTASVDFSPPSIWLGTCKEATALLVYHILLLGAD
jgi:hypothetical protein